MKALKTILIVLLILVIIGLICFMAVELPKRLENGDGEGGNIIVDGGEKTPDEKEPGGTGSITPGGTTGDTDPQKCVHEFNTVQIKDSQRLETFGSDVENKPISQFDLEYKFDFTIGDRQYIWYLCRYKDESLGYWYVDSKNIELLYLKDWRVYDELFSLDEYVTVTKIDLVNAITDTITFVTFQVAIGDCEKCGDVSPFTAENLGVTTEPGGETDPPCAHNFWSEKQTETFASPILSKIGGNMPTEFSGYYAGYRLEFEEGGESYVFYMLSMSESLDEFDILTEDSDVLAQVQSEWLDADGMEVSFEIADGIKILTIFDEGILQGTFQQFSIKYAVKGDTCVKCGAKAS